MRRALFAFLGLSVCTVVGLAQSTPSAGPYKVLQTAKVGGEGGWDYIYAEPVGRRLYIPRGAAAARAATDSSPAVEAVEKRLTIWSLDTLARVGEIAGVGGNGAAVCPKTGHGFTSDHPKPSMFDVATMKFIKNIDVPEGFQADGIYCDTFNDHVYIFSHPTKSALDIDAKDGTVLANIDLGGTPEQGVADGKGTLYVVMQDRPGGVAVVDVKTMKTTAHYSFGENGGCNGLALDTKNNVLFAACAAVGPGPQRGQPSPAPTPGAPPPQTFVILSAKDGTILSRLPLAANSDGATFNPQTLEAFSTGGGTLTIIKEKSSKAFESEQVLPTMGNSRTIAFDSKTGHIFTMAQEFAPPPPAAIGAAPAPGGRGAGRGAAIPGSFTILMIGK
jgi:DNA-binding beta-propeller fold protein YncE